MHSHPQITPWMQLEMESASEIRSPSKGVPNVISKLLMRLEPPESRLSLHSVSGNNPNRNLPLNSRLDRRRGLSRNSRCFVITSGYDPTVITQPYPIVLFDFNKMAKRTGSSMDNIVQLGNLLSEALSIMKPER